MMHSQTNQTSQAGLMLTTDSLRPVNALTRTSPNPGFLDYTTYRNLLIRDGHLENSHPAYSPAAPAQPLKSSLQLISLEGQNGDKTDFRADQALWSMDNLPHVLYLLQPPPDWITHKDLKDPPMKEYQIHGKILRDLPILPDHISSKVEGWRVQAWYSLDARIKLSDILARIGTRTNGNTVMMRMLRFRTDCPALGWANKGPKFDAEQTRIEQLMGEAGLDPACGSTRGLAWGLVDPANQGSRRIMIPNAKAWESSVEVPTLDHLTSIPSTTMSGYSQPAATNTPLSRGHDDTRSSEGGAGYLISDAEEEQMEDDTEMFDFEPLDSYAIQPQSMQPPSMQLQSMQPQSIYPRPEEVPRPLSITNPLQYQQSFGVEKKEPLKYHPCF